MTIKHRVKSAPKWNGTCTRSGPFINQIKWVLLKSSFSTFCGNRGRLCLGRLFSFILRRSISISMSANERGKASRKCVSGKSPKYTEKCFYFAIMLTVLHGLSAKMESALCAFDFYKFVVVDALCDAYTMRNKEQQEVCRVYKTKTFQNLDNANREKKKQKSDVNQFINTHHSTRKVSSEHIQKMLEKQKEQKKNLKKNKRKEELLARKWDMFYITMTMKKRKLYFCSVPREFRMRFFSYCALYCTVSAACGSAAFLFSLLLNRIFCFWMISFSFRSAFFLCSCIVFGLTLLLVLRFSSFPQASARQKVRETIEEYSQRIF